MWLLPVPRGSQFAAVVVVLDQRDHAGQQMPLHPLVELRGLDAGGSQQHVDPLLLGELPPPLEQLVHVHVGHLDRLQVPDDERRALLALLVEILHRDDGPDAAGQQLLVLLRTVAVLISTPLVPRLDSSASYTSRFSFSVTVTLSMIFRLPRSRMIDLIFSASSGRT
jgi:hypothetical protein